MAVITFMGEIIGKVPNMDETRYALFLKENLPTAEEFVKHVKVKIPNGQTIADAPCVPHVRPAELWVDAALAKKFTEGDEVEVICEYFVYRNPWFNDDYKVKKWKHFDNTRISVLEIKAVQKKTKAA